MVYTGKPSTGCRTCRQRRIKCDETRPSCQQCLKSRRRCLGYPDQSDLIFQNQTTAVIRRANRINDANARKAAAAAGGGGSVVSGSRSASRGGTSAVPSPSITEGEGASTTTSPTLSLSLSHSHPHSPSSLSGASPMDPWVLLASRTILVNPTEPVENRALSLDPSPSMFPERHHQPPTSRLSNPPTNPSPADFFLTNTILPPVTPSHSTSSSPSTTPSPTSSHHSGPGHLSLLPPLYATSSTHSALAKVTICMSLAAFCIITPSPSSSRFSLTQRAYAAYGEAVRALASALRDPVEQARNETLLACVVMVVVESLLSLLAGDSAGEGGGGGGRRRRRRGEVKAPSREWADHVRGAGQLLRMRVRRGGWESVMGDRVAKRLWGVVRGFMARGSEERGVDLKGDEFWGRVLPNDDGPLGVDGRVVVPWETRLGGLSTRVSGVRDRGLGLLLSFSLSSSSLSSTWNGGTPSEKDKEGGRRMLDALVAECTAIDAELCAWEQSLPDEYRYGVVRKGDLPRRSPYCSRVEGGDWGSATNGGGASPSASASVSSTPKPITPSVVDLVPDTLHRYPAPHLQRLWNSYRISRIVVLTLLYRSLTLPVQYGPTGIHDCAALATSTATLLAQLVDDVLASIPPHVLDPVVFERPRSVGMAAEITLAYYCLWPLYLARGVKILGAEKRRAIREVMGRIVDRYALRGGLDLMVVGDSQVKYGDLGKEKGKGMVGEDGGEEEDDEGGGDRPLWCGAWESSWMEGVWEWTFLYGCGAV